MRFFFILSTAIASALAIPSASIVAEPQQTAAALGNFKLALPDGAFPDDIHQQEEPPLMDAEDSGLDSSNLGYKNLQFTNHIKITLLPPSEQNELNELNDAVHEENKDFKVVSASNTARRYKKYADDFPVISSAEPSGVHQKKVVGMDVNGQMKYLEIPYYNRASTA